MKSEQLNEILLGFKVQQREKDIDWKNRMKISMEESDRREKEAKLLLNGKIHKANIKDYKKWLTGYLSQGGKTTHYYDYDMSDDTWFVAVRDFKIAPLYGANAKNIIVMSGVKFEGGDFGHTELYFMDGYKHIGDWIPIYENIKF